MTANSGQELGLTKLVAIVLFLIVGGIYCRTFFRHYVSEPARSAERAVAPLEQMRAAGPSMIPPMIPPGPMREYVTTGDEQAKQLLIQEAKTRWRRAHALAIWGSFAVACISIIIVISLALSMLLERRA